MQYDAAIIGGGLAGAAAARELAERGLSVVVVEKARGAGGRLSTRRKDGLSFDHGAQYFTARDSNFERQVARWVENGTVTDWQARIGVIDSSGVSSTRTDTRRYIGVPGMNALCKNLLADGAECRYGWQVRATSRYGGAWHLRSTDGETLASRWLICTAPPAQARSLITHGGARRVLDKVSLAPCWAVMVQFDRPLLTDWDAAFVNTGPLSWIASQDSRVNRPTANCWVLHASPAWSDQHLELTGEQVACDLVQAATGLPGAQPARPLFATAHRWRYSMAREPLEAGAVAFEDDSLVFAGDWCAGSRVEGAWLSGMAASRYI